MMAATTKRSSGLAQEDLETDTSPADDSQSKSGWCMTGRHRPGYQTVGCKRVFTTFVCPCECHYEPNADDPAWDSPGAPEHLETDISPEG